VDSIIRALVVYLLLLIIFRIAGKRALSQQTTFDLVLVLIISEAVQQALLDNDNSMTNAVLVVLSLVAFDIIVSKASFRSEKLSKWLEGKPVVLMEEGRLHPQYMARERVTTAEILQAGRDKHGLARLEQIDYAVVEQSGDITVVPRAETA